MAISSPNGLVECTIEGHVATITFSTPAHNALPADILARLAASIDEVGTRDKVRVVVLQSGGDRTFCAGASFDELMAINDAQTGKAFFMGFARVILACRRCPKPIVGRIQGKAIGGGVGLAAAVDYALASEHAAVRLSEVSIGIGPFVVGPAIQRKIGVAAFGHLSLDPASFKPASWALAHGLYAELHPSLEALDAAVHAFATRLASYSAEASSTLKRILWEGTEAWEDLLEERAALSGRLVVSPDTRAALLRLKA